MNSLSASKVSPGLGTQKQDLQGDKFLHKKGCVSWEAGSEGLIRPLYKSTQEQWKESGLLSN